MNNTINFNTYCHCKICNSELAQSEIVLLDPKIKEYIGCKHCVQFVANNGELSVCPHCKTELGIGDIYFLDSKLNENQEHSYIGCLYCIDSSTAINYFEK